MYRILKIAAAAIVFVFTLLGIFSQTAYAEVEVPQKVRIGIYFRSNQVNNSSDSFNASAEKGMELGFAGEKGDFIKLYEVKDPEELTIRKGSGTFHVKLGEDYEDISTASAKALEYKQKGIDAFPAFTGIWEVWSGFYGEYIQAESELNEKIKDFLKDEKYYIIEQGSGSIVVESRESGILYLYAFTNGYFQMRPRSESNPYILNINGTRYRGEIEVRRLDYSDMTVINILPLEQYLYGVVPCEIEPDSHTEALKAQAVAARTYTLNNINKYQGYGFDLCNTVYSQVYRGYDAEKPSTNSAVDDTAGKKVVYNGRLAQTYYFSSSGGQTEDSENVWGYEYPYLKSVEDRYESGKSWNYNWESKFTASDIKKAMLEKGFDIGDITDIQITKRTDAGRATELAVMGTKGKKIFQRGQCRSVLNPLHSQWYEIWTDSDVFAAQNEGVPQKIRIFGRSVISADGVKKISQSTGTIKVIGEKNSSKRLSVTPKQYVCPTVSGIHYIPEAIEEIISKIPKSIIYYSLSYIFHQV
jgi:stage II sporulation protein D